MVPAAIWPLIESGRYGWKSKKVIEMDAPVIWTGVFVRITVVLLASRFKEIMVCIYCDRIRIKIGKTLSNYLA